MADKFYPAPADEHAGDPKQAVEGRQADLEKGMEGTFPVSDPVSKTLPKPSKD